MVNPISGAHAATLIQSSIPQRLYGRVVAIQRVAMWGGLTLGSVVGGVLGETIGLRPTVALAGVCPMLGLVWLALSPVRSVHETPAPASATV